MTKAINSELETIRTDFKKLESHDTMFLETYINMMALIEALVKDRVEVRDALKDIASTDCMVDGTYFNLTRPKALKAFALLSDDRRID